MIRQALPILQKAYDSNQRADLRKLTDHELHELKTALQAAEDARPRTHVANVNA
jgi:predicted lipid-binding transport protein (Tim44 family)